MHRIALLLIVWSTPAHADGDETIVVIGKAPDRAATPDRERALDDAPFVTVIHSDGHPATASVADAVGAAVGAQTRSLGGLGAFESVTVRGASPGHTEVLFDGVPLARIAAVTTDLGRFALSAFGQVELYRGAVPVELGGAGVGGALNLVTRLGRGEHGERFSASLGTGSFGARHLRLHYGDTHGAWASSTTIGYQGATGDYTYFSDNGTQLVATDDSYKTRTNDNFDQLDVASRIGTSGDVYGVRLAYKDQGLPGSATFPTLQASLSTLDAIGDGHHDIVLEHVTGKQLVYALVERQHLRDPLGELGLGAEARDYVTLSGGAASTWIAAIGRHRATAGIELRGDRFSDRDANAARAALTGNRIDGAALAAFDIAADPDADIVVTPAVRLDLVHTSPTPMVEDPKPVMTRDDAMVSPRLSARAAVTSAASIKGSAGRYVRLPTLVELFGDRGTLVGSPELLPETGTNADLGFVIAPEHAHAIPVDNVGELAVDRIFLETAAFATRVHDTIALVPAAGSSAYHAINIADAQTYGLEVAGSARFGHTLSLTANYTHLATEQLTEDPNYAHKALPRQPSDVVYARADVVRTAFDREATVWLDANWQSDTFLDQANLQPLPARTLVGVGARIEIMPSVGIAFSVANLANVRTEQIALSPAPRPDLTSVATPLADYFGFPLPGRSYYVSLDWSHK